MKFKENFLYDGQPPLVVRGREFSDSVAESVARAIGERNGLKEKLVWQPEISRFETKNLDYGFGMEVVTRTGDVNDLMVRAEYGSYGLIAGEVRMMVQENRSADVFRMLWPNRGWGHYALTRYAQTSWDVGTGGNMSVFEKIAKHNGDKPDEGSVMLVLSKSGSDGVETPGGLLWRGKVTMESLEEGNPMLSDVYVSGWSKPLNWKTVRKYLDRADMKMGVLIQNLSEQMWMTRRQSWR